MKIICIGRNYVDHAKELDNPIPKKPLVFMKPTSAMLVNEKPFYYPEFSKDIHYELELVIKIVKNGKHVQPAFAKDYYQFCTVGIDLTARDIQSQCKSKGHPWEIAKAFDGSAILGQWVEVKDIVNAKFKLLEDGQVVQEGSPKDMIFSIEEIIVHVSKYFTLNTGDLIFTGTPVGVGPIKIGSSYEGFLNGQKLLHCDVK